MIAFSSPLLSSKMSFGLNWDPSHTLLVFPPQYLEMMEWNYAANAAANSPIT